jgi:ribosomal-protein-alanine N-acetyltransferase
MDPIILTERLSLRPLAAADAEPTARLMTRDIARWTGSWTGCDTAGDVAARIARARDMAAQGVALDRAITLKDGGALIGWIGARRPPGERRASIGYWIGEAWFGRGYTREAARGLLDHAWTALDVDVIEGAAQLANTASIAVLKGLGMRYVGQRQEFAPARGAADLCAVYEIERPPPAAL